MRVSHMVGFAAAEAMVAEAERIRATYGITTFKVKVGRQPYRQDVEACRALRAAMPDAEIYIDGNRGWTPSESARALREMADLDLAFAEELCPADDVLGRRWLVEHSPVPMYADESVPTAADVTRELLAGAATGIAIKTSRTGFTAQPADPRPVRGHGRRGRTSATRSTPRSAPCALQRSARRTPSRLVARPSCRTSST